MIDVGIGVQQAFGADGCQFGARTAVTVGITTSVVIPKGLWIVEPGANALVRYTYNYPTGTFVTIVAASGVELIYSDGFNVEFLGDGTGGTARRSAVLSTSA